MIDWDNLFLAVSLSLPELVAPGAAIVFLLRRRGSLDGDVLAWLIVPCAAILFSTFTRFLPLSLEPVQDVVGTSNDNLATFWYGDLLFRSAAWTALLYGVFWNLPQREPTPPLDARSRRAAMAAALLAVLLADTRRESDERPR